MKKIETECKEIVDYAHHDSLETQPAFANGAFLAQE